MAPTPKWKAPKEVIQKFAIVTHVHPLPVCRGKSRYCKGKGIFIGCVKVTQGPRRPPPPGETFPTAITVTSPCART